MVGSHLEGCLDVLGDVHGKLARLMFLFDQQQPTGVVELDRHRHNSAP